MESESWVCSKRRPRKGSLGKDSRPSFALMVGRGVLEDWGWMWRFCGHRYKYKAKVGVEMGQDFGQNEKSELLKNCPFDGEDEKICATTVVGTFALVH